MKHQNYAAFAVLLLTGTLVFNSCKSYDVTPHYTSRYITTNTGKVTVTAPEAYELGLTLLALTNVAQRDTSLINTATPYYKELWKYFNKYKDHKAVKQLNTDLSASPKLVEKFRNGLFAFKVINRRFALNENYRIDNSKIQFQRYALLLESFYHDTNFGKFHTAHQDTYQSMIKKAENLVSFQNLQSTINKDVKSYRVLVSPLTKGIAGTMTIKSTDFSECVIFPYLTSNSLIYEQKK